MVLQLNHLFKKHTELATLITSQNSSIEDFFANSFTQSQEPNEAQQNIQNLIVVLDLFGMEIIEFNIGIIKIANAARFCEYPRDLLFQALGSLSCRLKLCHLDRFSDAVSSIIYQSQQILSNNQIEQKTSSQSKHNPMKQQHFQGKKLFNELEEIETADKENQIYLSSKKKQLQEIFYFEEIFEEDKQEHQHQETINPLDQTIQSDREIDLFSTPQFCQFSQSHILASNKDSVPAANSWTFNSNRNQSEGMYNENMLGQMLDQTIYKPRKILQEINVPQESLGQHLMEKMDFKVQKNKGISSSDKMTEEIDLAKIDSTNIDISDVPLYNQQIQYDQIQLKEMQSAPQVIHGQSIQQLKSAFHFKCQPKLQKSEDDSYNLNNITHKSDSITIRKPNNNLEQQIETFELTPQIKVQLQQQQSFQAANKCQFPNEFDSNILEMQTIKIQEQQAVQMLVEASFSGQKNEKLEVSSSSNFQQTQEYVLREEPQNLQVNEEYEGNFIKNACLNFEHEFIFEQQSQKLKENNQINQNKIPQTFLEQIQNHQDFLNNNNKSEIIQTQNIHLQEQQNEQQYPQQYQNIGQANQQQQLPISQYNQPLQDDLGLFVIEIERRQNNSEISEYDKETALKGYQDSRLRSAVSVLTDIQGNHGQEHYHYPQQLINNSDVNEDQLEVFTDQWTLPKENRIVLQEMDDTIDKNRLNIINLNNNQHHNIQVNPFMIPQNLIVNENENNNNQQEEEDQMQREEQNGIDEEQRRRSSQRRAQRNNQQSYNNRDQILEEYYRQVQELRSNNGVQQSQRQLIRENGVERNDSQSRNVELIDQNDNAVMEISQDIDSSKTNNSNNHVQQQFFRQKNRRKLHQNQQSGRIIGICKWVQKYNTFINNDRRINYLRGLLSSIVQKHILKGFEGLSTERKSMVIIASITVGMTIIL